MSLATIVPEQVPGALSVATTAFPSIVLPSDIASNIVAPNAQVIQLTQITIEQNIHVSDSKESQESKEFQEEQEEHQRLTDAQIEVVAELYHVAKECAKTIFSLASLDHAVKIGRLMGEIMKLLERVTPRGKRIPGPEKRVIALELGRQIIADSEVISDDGVRMAIGVVYDAVGETMLETLVEVSRHVNVMIKGVAVSCCEGLMACLKK